MVYLSFFEKKRRKVCRYEKKSYLCNRNRETNNVSRNKQCFKRCPDGGIGRRAGLKHQWIHFHPGSTPGLGTNKP